MKKITESPSKYRHLEQKSVLELLTNINQEDRSVPDAVGKVIPIIEAAVKMIVAKMKQGGRLFYIGAGTSGRLGILDASECPPTFGVAHDRVIGLIAGGDAAIRMSKENAEDDSEQAFKDLQAFQLTDKDVVIGIAASGTTPYVVGGLAACQKNGIITACITCNHKTPLAQNANYPIEVIVGPEFVTGSTRMKAGTAQKLILNMISTTVMIQLGHVKDNRMIDMQLTNDKLKNRGAKMIQEKLSISYHQAQILLQRYGSVRKALQHFE